MLARLIVESVARNEMRLKKLINAIYTSDNIDRKDDEESSGFWEKS